MVKNSKDKQINNPPTEFDRSLELWELGITELTGHNIESQGREAVNQMLQDGWILLHIYTLKYKEDNAWRERPMAILGKPNTINKKTTKRKVETHNNTTDT